MHNRFRCLKYIDAQRLCACSHIYARLAGHINRFVRRAMYPYRIVVDSFKLTPMGEIAKTPVIGISQHMDIFIAAFGAEIEDCFY